MKNRTGCECNYTESTEARCMCACAVEFNRKWFEKSNWIFSQNEKKNEIFNIQSAKKYRCFVQLHLMWCFTMPRRSYWLCCMLLRINIWTDQINIVSDRIGAHCMRNRNGQEKLCEISNRLFFSKCSCLLLAKRWRRQPQRNIRCALANFRF